MIIRRALLQSWILLSFVLICDGMERRNSTMLEKEQSKHNNEYLQHFVGSLYEQRHQKDNPEKPYFIEKPYFENEKLTVRSPVINAKVKHVHDNQDQCATCKPFYKTYNKQQTRRILWFVQQKKVVTPHCLTKENHAYGCLACDDYRQLQFLIFCNMAEKGCLKNGYECTEISHMACLNSLSVESVNEKKNKIYALIESFPDRFTHHL